MSALNYISEKEFSKIIEQEAKRTQDQGKNYIMSPKGFATHLISTGQKAERIAKQILQNHPSLENSVNPGIVRVAGFVHDFGRFNVGDPLHEIDGAYTIMTKGEKFNLVYGGNSAETENALKRIAKCLPSDGLVFEQLGEAKFQDKILEPVFYTPDINFKLHYLQKNLSSGKTPLRLEELTSPKTLEQRIVIYADYKNLEGEDMSLAQRMQEVCQRYEETSRNVSMEEVENYRLVAPDVSLNDLQNHYKNVSLFVQQTMHHIIAFVDSIDELLKK